MPSGYMGKLLFVDLSTGEIKEEASTIRCAVTSLVVMVSVRGRCTAARNPA